MDAYVTNEEEKRSDKKGKEGKIRCKKKIKEMCQCDKIVMSRGKLTQKT
jgi:hypothetical protein